MTDHIPDDISPEGRDLREYTDELRQHHAIVKNTLGEWVLLKHGDVVAAALDHESFSNNVSSYLQIPNGLDGEEHTHYRKIIDQYLSEDALEPYIPVFKKVAAELMDELPRGEVLDAVSDIGAVFAVRAQCAWLGWPDELEPQLLKWMSDNHAATRSKNHDKMALVAEQFDQIIQSIVRPRRERQVQQNSDITTRLCHDLIHGRKLTEAEITSILRNWTGGDLGSIALCVGVIVHQIAKEPELIDMLRKASNSEVEAFIDEALRIDDPFVSNRRVTTCALRIGGQEIPEGARVKLHWTSANRDEAVFKQNAFSPNENGPDNLVYGVGKHACPGRLLATWELRIMLQALLSAVRQIDIAAGQEPEREIAPLGGFHRVPVILL
ncbi:cytochrome P450 [Seongchinamella sediminis]|uniref:Cytochrome P450 n=1 Tax=Seongchinamella sediminis TaxID=2283635 RepID=A0A3L7DW60_9GAMM|nr:cytochrome P450 [Seongchinamella sediminis]RLQ20850.1 cytochrome P450 [Seongchinamella sediminis]